MKQCAAAFKTYSSVQKKKKKNKKKKKKRTKKKERKKPQIKPNNLSSPPTQSSGRMRVSDAKLTESQIFTVLTL